MCGRAGEAELTLVLTGQAAKEMVATLRASYGVGGVTCLRHIQWNAPGVTCSSFFASEVCTDSCYV